MTSLVCRDCGTTKIVTVSERGLLCIRCYENLVLRDEVNRLAKLCVKQGTELDRLDKIRAISASEIDSLKKDLDFSIEQTCAARLEKDVLKKRIQDQEAVIGYMSNDICRYIERERELSSEILSLKTPRIWQ